MELVALKTLKGIYTCIINVEAVNPMANIIACAINICKSVIGEKVKMNFC